MKAIISKLLPSLLVANMLLTSVVPTTARGAEEIPVTPDQTSEAPATTEETVLDSIQTIQTQEDWIPSEPETDPDPTPYTDEDIRALTWTQLSADTAIEIQHTYDRPLLQLAAYFYSDLLQLLAKEEKLEVLAYTESQAFSDVERLSADQRALLDTHTPAIGQRLAWKNEYDDTIELQDTNLPPVQYTEKQQEYQYSRSKTEQPVDEFYRAANVSENDVVLEGKHGLDLVLQRRYHSLSSRITTPGWNESMQVNVPNKNDAGFAMGWEFTIPNVEVVKSEQLINPANRNETTTQTYYATTKDITKYNIQLDDGTALEYDGGFVNYPYSDASFSTDGYTKHTLYFQNYKYEFDGDTVVKSNIYGDKITFNVTKSGYPNWIKDSVGRFLVFTNGEQSSDLIVYQDEQKSKILKHLKYAKSKPASGSSYYYQLNAVQEVPVEDGVEGTPVTLSTYSYSLRNSYFNLYKNYTVDKEIASNALESARYIQTDKNTRKEIVSLLLDQVSYPVQGLSIAYAYQQYNPNAENPLKDGLVRLFEDKYALTYVAYSPVSYVAYSYTVNTPGGNKSYLYEKRYDNSNFYEIWKIPKSQNLRFATSNTQRRGDIVTYTEVPTTTSPYTLSKTYQVNQDGQHVLKLVRMSAGGDIPVFTGKRYPLSYNSTTYTSFAYAGRNTKPTYQYEFLEPTSDMGSPAVYTDYLKNPDIGNRAKYAAILSNYAHETYYEYDTAGHLIKQLDPNGNKMAWTYQNTRVSYPVVTVTGLSGTGNYSTLMSMKKQSSDSNSDPYYHEELYTYLSNYLLKSESITDSYPVNETSYKTTTVARTYEYNDKTLYSIAENLGAGKTRTQTFTAYDRYGLYPTTISIYGVDVGNGQKILSVQSTYDEKALLRSQTYPDGSTVQYDYDGFDRQKRAMFRNQSFSRSTLYSYTDGGQRKIEQTLADGTKVVTYYTPYGDVVYQEQVGTNRSTRPLVYNEYGSDGRLLSLTVPFGKSSGQTVYKYFWDGSLKQEQNAVGITTYAKANAYKDGSTYLPQAASQVESPNGYVRYEYQDRFGNPDSSEERTKDGSKQRLTTFKTDRFGQVIRKEIADGSKTRTWESRYDPAGKLVYLLDPERNKYEYLYDMLGNLLNVKENGVDTATYTYNSLSWKLSEQNPETASTPESYTYFENGLLKTYRDKNGITFDYSYTPFYELTKTQASSGFFESHLYNRDSGLLESESNSDGNTVSYAYDPFQRNNSITMMGRTYQLAHNDNDNFADTVTYPSGNGVDGTSLAAMTVSYTRDAADRLQSVTIPGVGQTTYQYQVGSYGQTNTVSYPNSTGMTQTINPFGEMTEMRHSDNWVETNSYDLFGNVTSQKRMGTEVGAFVYDKLDRIKEETVQGKKRLYAYDQRGNRQFSAFAAGNVGKSYSLKYDVFNRVKEYSETGKKATYSYYPNGLRASKQVTGSGADTTKYVYLDGQVIEELAADGKIKARNVWGNKLIWRKDMGSSKQGYYYYNTHGDVVSIKDPSGTTLNSYEYDIWGNLVTDKVKETMSNPFTYAGEMYDKESEWYYLRARYYNPAIGRFITEDTYKGQVDNPLSLNRYTYVHNNPLRYFDPSGHKVTQYESQSEEWFEKAYNDVVNGSRSLEGLSDQAKLKIKQRIYSPVIKDEGYDWFVSGLASGLAAIEAVQVAVVYAEYRALKSVGIASSPVTSLNPTNIKFSQNSAGGNGRYAPLKESMQKNGWNGQPVDVIMSPNGYVTIDNTRVAIARELNMESIPVTLRSMDELLPESMAGRFGTAKTWGEALQYRTSNQRPPLPIDGTDKLPRLPR